MDDELKLHKFSARIAPISVHRPYERQVIFKRVYPVVLHLYDQMTRRQDDRCGFILSSRDTVGEFNFMTAMSACFSRLSLADAEFILHRGISQQYHLVIWSHTLFNRDNG